MTEQEVCAVVVTYHPDSSMIQNLSAAIAQVNAMVVVDNGSNPDAIAALRSARNNHGFNLIENQENLGIAEALNQGVRWAIANGFPWVILFDQDSRITDSFVREMFAAWDNHPQRSLVASIHPRYVQPETGREAFVRRADDGGPIKSMTSGALMPVWIFNKIGWFASEYFIDEVDTEYCFRIRTSGFLIADSPRARLMHSVGHPDPVSILGFTFRPTWHSAVRRYYMSRNRFVVYRKYIRARPGWVLHSMYESLRETVKCFLGETDRMHKFRNFLLGTWDGLIGKMGKREDL